MDHKNKTRLVQTRELPERQKEFCGRTYLGEMLGKWRHRLWGYLLAFTLWDTITLCVRTSAQALPVRTGRQH
jgi:hypothetical protein